MIQEPQQPEIIEIPVVNQLLNTTVQSSLKNQNNKNQKTLIQIQPKNSKPRIFLLTRPSKSRLVRLETHRVQPHHPQKIARATQANIASQQQSQTKIIRIPFLTRSQVQTLSVKSNTNQSLKKDTIIVPQDTVQYTNESHSTDQRSSQTQTQLYPIIQEETNQTNQLSPTLITCTETSSNQSVKNTIHKSTVQKSNQSKPKAQSLVPLTLASMAGIELTGADMSLSQADMSGAMPPTATVEEINVPVFIDEYLQEATAASTTSVTTNNIFNINNNNNKTSNNISNNNNQSNEKGNEVNNCLDAFENFEFDIDLLTENNSKNKDITTIELQEEKQQQQHLEQEKLQQYQQHQLTEVVDNDKKEHQLELQLMLEDILFNNKNNSSNSNTSCKTYNIFNNNNINNTTTSINDNNNLNNNNNNMNNMATTCDFSEEFDSTDLFKVAPYSQMSEHILTPDDIDENLSLGMELAMELSNAEYAVDINCMTNEPSLNECFLHSQPSDIMLSSGYGPSSLSSSSQNLINEISKAEPHIPDSTYSVLPTTSSIVMESVLCEANEDTQYDWASQCNVENPLEEWKENKSLNNPLKRQSPQTSKHMQEKRLKLRLDTKSCKENISSQQSDISTPNVINLIMNEEFANTMGPIAENSIDSIINDLVSTSPIKSEVICEDTSVSLSPPNTPYSVNSISNQTNFTGFSAPSSPASSIATTTNTSVTTTKRGRGRPAKQHSYIPLPSQIKHLTETEQKKILERAKNNEASRKSRLKHKERDNALEREERELQERNLELNTSLKEYKRMETKLRNALERQFRNIK